MNKNPTKLTDLDSCPFCNCRTVYTKDWVEGSTISTYDFKLNREPVSINNDLLQHHTGSRVYCFNCHKCLGNFQDNTLSATVLKHIEKSSKNV